MFFVLLLLGSFVSAQLEGLENKLEDVEERLEGVEDFIDDPEQETKNYLREERTELLEKYPWGRFLLKISEMLDFFSPVFKIFIGIEYSFSWLFLLTIVFWITFVIYFGSILSGFSSFSEVVSFVLAISFAVILSVVDFFRGLSELLINVISSFGVWWVQLILVIIVIIGLIFASIFHRTVKLWATKLRRRKASAKREEKLLRSEANMKRIEKFSKMVTDEAGDN